MKHFFLHKRNGNHTQKNLEWRNITLKKEETRKITEYHQTKLTDKNTREIRQWRHQTTRK